MFAGWRRGSGALRRRRVAMASAVLVTAALAVPLAASPAHADTACPWRGGVTLTTNATSYTTNDASAPTITATVCPYLTWGDTLRG